MPWSSMIKDISVTSITPHALARPGGLGRAPAITEIRFSPIEFFGAAARCSHMHVINPTVVTPESLIVSALVENHVDNVSSDFAILPSVKQFKDFVKSYFVGTVAAGIAYLQMIRDGYVWLAHFENLVGGSPDATKKPDFVLSRDGESTVALLESKGTRSAARGSFNSRIARGYLDQVEPHLGFPVGPSQASHGFCIGGWLTSPTSAELNVHHTALPVREGGSQDPSNSGGAPSEGGPLGGAGSVQRDNYAAVFRLVHSEDLARQILRGRLAPGVIRFVELDWMGRKFLTFPLPARLRLAQAPASSSGSDSALFSDRIFAIERNIASTIFASLSADPDEQIRQPNLTPIPHELSDRARGDGGALFPDGCAVVTGKCDISAEAIVVWDKNHLGPERQFAAVRDTVEVQKLLLGYLSACGEM